MTDYRAPGGQRQNRSKDRELEVFIIVPETAVYDFFDGYPRPIDGVDEWLDLVDRRGLASMIRHNSGRDRDPSFEPW